MFSIQKGTVAEMYPSWEHIGNIDDSLKICSLKRQRCDIDATLMISMQTLMIINVFTVLTSETLLFHWWFFGETLNINNDYKVQYFKTLILKLIFMYHWCLVLKISSFTIYKKANDRRVSKVMYFLQKTDQEVFLDTWLYFSSKQIAQSVPLYAWNHF